MRKFAMLAAVVMLAACAKADDNETAVRTRLEAYHRQTMPVAAYYRSKNVLKEVDGTGPMDEVFERIEQSLSYEAPVS